MARKVRYAVIGLGRFAEVAVLPAFRHATKNSELAAIVSDEPKRLGTLAREHRVPHPIYYDQLDDLLASDEIDAVYVATPNALHGDFALRAARARKHVLTEGPMATTEDDCQALIAAAEEAGVKLLVGYRLHFEEAHRLAVELVRKGRLGAPRLFLSFCSLQAQPGDIRLEGERGGGPLFDIGVHCVNAARSLFREEPIEVTALTAAGADPRFAEVEEAVGATLRFPDEKLASFVVSYGVPAMGWYEVMGSRGKLRVDPAFSYAGPLGHELTIGDRRPGRMTFKKRDPIAAALLYFSDCILRDRAPEPSGVEGLADVRVLRAILRSAETGRAVVLGDFAGRERRPLELEHREAPVGRPPTVDVPPAHR